jgi:hypothetical protein
MFTEKIAGTPAAIQMFQQGLRLELGQDIDRQDAGVHEIRQHKIDDPISPAEWNCGLGPVLRQRKKAFASPARQYDP